MWAILRRALWDNTKSVGGVVWTLLSIAGGTAIALKWGIGWFVAGVAVAISLVLGRTAWHLAQRLAASETSEAQATRRIGIRDAVGELHARGDKIASEMRRHRNELEASRAFEGAFIAEKSASSWTRQDRGSNYGVWLRDVGNYLASMPELGQAARARFEAKSGLPPFPPRMTQFKHLEFEIGAIEVQLARLEVFMHELPIE